MLDEIVRRRKQGWEVVVVGYHPDLYGKSKGTRGMLEMADRAGFEIRFRDRPRGTVKYVRPWEKQR